MYSIMEGRRQLLGVGATIYFYTLLYTCRPIVTRMSATYCNPLLIFCLFGEPVHGMLSSKVHVSHSMVM